MDMCFLSILLMLPLLARAYPMSGCSDENELECQNDTTSIATVQKAESASNSRENQSSENKALEDWLTTFYQSDRKDTDDRTWRVNRKALVPIIIGMGLIGLAVVPLALTGLSILGTIAIAMSKLSLGVSAVMSLRRFFGIDQFSGGFKGLDPLAYPHASHAPADHKFGQNIHKRIFMNPHFYRG